MPELSQEEFDQFKEDLRIVKFQNQEHQDLIEGGITSRNLASFRNTYVINAQDSLDASFPMYVHFNIINEMIKIVSVKVSFWILNYRAYSTAAASGGGSTSGAGGLTTPTSSTESQFRTLRYVVGGIIAHDVGWLINAYTENVKVANYAHTHTVSIPNHTHSTPNHTHDITYGIYEETNSPIIKFYISENEGVSYNDKFFGNYDTDKSDLDITSLLTGSGSKLIKFESDLRARLSVQIEIKLDIKARS